MVRPCEKQAISRLISYSSESRKVSTGTDLGLVDVSTDFSANRKSPCIEDVPFHRCKESILTPNPEIKGSKVSLAEDKAARIAIKGTVVGRT
ncbi:hypothetical protein N7493_011303 [Penicillium malachiteum]|uniref:Uncharacterized protein n=1 Tax=Penicillium malachiteum TaxID=1324776 RepID=A0AAD6MR58_9EURO|nr:hypothetical protein N7493_011303 [Penicillium malachiteum]